MESTEKNNSWWDIPMLMLRNIGLVAVVQLKHNCSSCRWISRQEGLILILMQFLATFPPRQAKKGRYIFFTCSFMRFKVCSSTFRCVFPFQANRDWLSNTTQFVWPRMPSGSTGNIQIHLRKVILWVLTKYKDVWTALMRWPEKRP